MQAIWHGESRRKPTVVRFRTEEFYGLRVTCWHGRKAELVWVDREVVESWEYPASLSPCRWVPACPNGRALLRTDATPAVAAVPATARPVPQSPGGTEPVLPNHPRWVPDQEPRYGPLPEPVAEEDGWHIRIACRDLCGMTVVVLPEKADSGARCVDCGRRYHGAAVPQRPPPGWTRHNGLRMGQGGENCYPIVRGVSG